jgi:hypothetical protein
MSDPVPSLSGRYVPAPAGMASSSASLTVASDGGEAVRPVWQCWPLSAAASAVLLAPRTDRDFVTSLALQELIADGTWSADTAGRRVLPGLPPRLLVRPAGGAVGACPPLPMLHSVLTEWIGSRPPPFWRPLLCEWGFDSIALWPDGYTLGSIGRTAQRSSEELWQAAVDDLCARGLLVRTQEGSSPWWRLLLTADVARTASGDAWARAAQAQLAQWRQAIERGGLTGDEAIRAANASPGLLLLLDASTKWAIDRRSASLWSGAPAQTPADHRREVRWERLRAVGGLAELHRRATQATATPSNGAGGGGGGD